MTLKQTTTTCKVLKCARRRRRSSTTTSSVTAVAATETLSFDLAEAKQAMYTALQEFAKSLKLTTGIVTPDLATDQDYTTAAVFVVKAKRQHQHAQVKCVPHSINGELCAFQTQFQYPDAMYVSFWFVSRNNNKNNKNGDNYPINWKEYFETQQLNKDDYFRTVLVVEKGGGGTRTKNNTCRALMERTKDHPLTFKKCSICNNNNNNNLETTTEGQQQEPPLMVSIDSTNIGARLGIEVFGKLWRGHKTTCESTDPVFFPLKTFHSWL